MDAAEERAQAFSDAALECLRICREYTAWAERFQADCERIFGKSAQEIAYWLPPPPPRNPRRIRYQPRFPD